MRLSTVEDRDSKRWSHAVPIIDSHSQSISCIGEAFPFPIRAEVLPLSPAFRRVARSNFHFSPSRLQASYRDLIQGKYRTIGKSLLCNEIRPIPTLLMRKRYPRYACGLVSIPGLCVNSYPGYAWKSANIHRTKRSVSGLPVNRLRFTLQSLRIVD